MVKKTYFAFFFACISQLVGSLVPQTGTEPGPTAVKASNHNHWITGEVPVFKLDSYLKYVLKWIK